jgi:hypothetical protein
VIVFRPTESPTVLPDVIESPAPPDTTREPALVRATPTPMPRLNPTPLPPAESTVALPTPTKPVGTRAYFPQVAVPGAQALVPGMRLTPLPGLPPDALAAAPPLTPTPAFTPVPAPTSEPSPTRMPMRATKLGVGLYDSGGAYLPELDRLRPSVILLMDPKQDFAESVRKMFPKAFIIGRVYDLKQPLDNPALRGVEFADRVAQQAVPLKGIVDTWMGYNEVTGHKDFANYRAYNAFQVAFARRLQDTYGIPAMAGNDGPGAVEPDEYATYFAEAISVSKFFGIHAYAPKGESAMRSSSSHYLVLRHREIEASLNRAGVKHGPFVITEAGLWDGWRGVVSDQAMADDYVWLADQLNADDYVIGVTVFGLFSRDRWTGFNISGTAMIDRIGLYNSQQPR